MMDRVPDTRLLAKRTASAFDRLWPPRVGVVILIYHRVGGRTATSVDLPSGLFEEQMAYLSDRCDVVSLDVAADRLEGKATGGQVPTVVITFDDGTADFVEEALPILARYGLPSTYYLATDFIERGVAFPDDGMPMTWGAVREAISSGLVDIGSHTHTHALLDRTSPSTAVTELDRSIELIGERTDVSVRHFSYPKAILGSPEAEVAVKSRFRTATVARTRANPYGRSNLHRLTRSPIQTSDGMEFFVRKAEGGMRLESDLRDVVNRWRYRRAAS